MNNSLNTKKRQKLGAYLAIGFLFANFIVPRIFFSMGIYPYGLILIIINLPSLLVAFFMYRWSTFSSQIKTISVLLFVLNLFDLIIETGLFPYPYSGFLVLCIVLIAFGLLLFSLAARGELIYGRFSTFIAIAMGLVIFQRALFDVISMFHDSDLFAGNSTFYVQVISLVISISIFTLELLALDAVYQEKLEFFD